ncbi:hypothetical protein [Lapillicoccus sp.]|uniref:hypothetical protein n=1 Tax=Lapillicoccus sp. TaxID=1909287 RepID=UPI003267A5FA
MTEPRRDAVHTDDVLLDLVGRRVSAAARGDELGVLLVALTAAVDAPGRSASRRPLRVSRHGRRGLAALTALGIAVSGATVAAAVEPRDAGPVVAVPATPSPAMAASTPFSRAAAPGGVERSPHSAAETGGAPVLSSPRPGSAAPPGSSGIPGARPSAGWSGGPSRGPSSGPWSGPADGTRSAPRAATPTASVSAPASAPSTSTQAPTDLPPAASVPPAAGAPAAASAALAISAVARPQSTPLLAVAAPDAAVSASWPDGATNGPAGLTGPTAGSADPSPASVRAAARKEARAAARAAAAAPGRHLGDRVGNRVGNGVGNRVGNGVGNGAAPTADLGAPDTDATDATALDQRPSSGLTAQTVPVSVSVPVPVDVPLDVVQEPLNGDRRMGG